MNYSLKTFILSIIIAVLSILLVACGNSYSKLTATKTINANTKDAYVEKNVVEFENNVATEIDTTMTFNDEESAAVMYVWLTDLVKERGYSEMRVYKRGLDIIITNDMETYSNYYTEFENKTTRKQIKDEFYFQGYTIEN